MYEHAHICSLPGCLCFLLLCLAAAVLAPFVIRPNWHWLSCNRARRGGRGWQKKQEKKEGAPRRSSAVLFGDLRHCFRPNCHIRDDDGDDDDVDFATTDSVAVLPYLYNCVLPDIMISK